MSNLRNIVYLSNEDYLTLVSTGSVTIGATTITYNVNDVYITPDVAKELHSSSTTTEGAIEYIESASYTPASSSGTDTFVKTINGGSGSLTPTFKYLHWSAGTTPPSAATWTGTKTNALVTDVSISAQGLSSVTGTYAESGSGSTARHTLTLEGGANSGIAVGQTKGDYTPAGSVSFTAGTAPSLVTNATETGGVKYMESATHSHTGASVATSGSAITGVSGGSLTATTKYLTLEEDE